MRREPGAGRGSLRTELLFQLACLAAAAVLLALWTAFLLQLPYFARAAHLWLFLLVGLDLVLFVLLGNFLIQRFVMRPLNETVVAARAIAAGDYNRRLPDGQTREIHAVATAVNRLTDQLLENQERLQENVRSLDRTNRLLLDAQRELIRAEKLASIGRLAAGVAHEVGNPLGSLFGYSAILRRRGGDGELLDGLEREARRIDSIVRGLLDYARPVSTDLEPVDVNASVCRVVDMLREQGRLERVEVDYRLADGLAAIEASRHSIEQVWVNLITNAETAMGGEGILRIASLHARYEGEPYAVTRRSDDPPGIDYSHLRRLKAPRSQPMVLMEPGTEIVQVVIADTGSGVPAEHADSIFDPFFTTKAPGEGTGLGLAIVASTLAELGGRIELAPTVGEGATFIVSLPIRRGEVT